MNEIRSCLILQCQHCYLRLASTLNSYFVPLSPLQSSCFPSQQIHLDYQYFHFWHYLLSLLLSLDPHHLIVVPCNIRMRGLLVRKLIIKGDLELCVFGWWDLNSILWFNSPRSTLKSRFMDQVTCLESWVSSDGLSVLSSSSFLLTWLSFSFSDSGTASSNFITDLSS